MKNSCAAFFFVQKRCEHAGAIIEKLTLKGYEKLKGESWGEFSYAEYFKNLHRARWIVALDPSLSAGQIIAEASLLGIPCFAFAGKPNARLLLPSELIVARDGSSEDIVSTSSTLSNRTTVEDARTVNFQCALKKQLKPS